MKHPSNKKNKSMHISRRVPEHVGFGIFVQWYGSQFPAQFWGHDVKLYWTNEQIKRTDLKEEVEVENDKYMSVQIVSSYSSVNFRHTKRCALITAVAHLASKPKRSNPN